MSLVALNSLVVNTLSSGPPAAGVAVGFVAGEAAPLPVGDDVCLGVSLGASLQVALPGDICACSVNTSAGPIAGGGLLVLPTAVVAAYPLTPGNFIPLTDVVTGSPIRYAMALEAKPPGGGLVRSLLLGAYPMPFVTPPTIPLTKGSNYMVRLATGSPVVQLPVVPANHVRIFGPTVFTGSPGTFSLDLIDASLAVFQLVNGLGATGNNLVFPALVAGETIRFTLANPPNLINISVSYLDVPVEVALGNTPIPVRHVFTDLTPFSIPAPAAGFTRRPWAPLGVAFDSGRAAVSGSTFGSTALWGCNPDTTNATFAQVKSDLAALIDIQLGNSVVAPTTPLAALGFGSSLINEQQTATITKTSVVTVRPPCVVGVYADVPLSP